MTNTISIYNSPTLDEIMANGRGAALLVHDEANPIGFENLLKTGGAFSEPTEMSAGHPPGPFLLVNDWRCLGSWMACERDVSQWVLHLSGTLANFPDLLKADLALSSVNQFLGRGLANEPFFVRGLDQIATVRSEYFERSIIQFCKTKGERATLKDIYLKNFLDQKMMYTEEVEGK